MNQRSSNNKEDLSHKVGFVIVNYNNYDILEDSLDNFLNIEMKSPIVIVDNSEDSEKYERLKSKYIYQKHILFYKAESNLGYSKGNNLGIKMLKEEFELVEFIAIINPDVIFDNKENFYKMIQYYIDNFREIGIITGIQHLNENIVIGSKIPGYLDIIMSRIPLLSSKRSRRNNKKLLQKRNQEVIDVGVVSGCFFVIAYHYFEKIGFFDENIFLYFEENIISYKLKKNNLKVYVYTDFEFNHNHKWKKWDYNSLMNYNRNYSASERYYVENYLGIKRHLFLDIQVYIYTKVYLKLKGKLYR